MSSAIKFRCSSIGKLMAEPKVKSETLSVGAKTYVRELAAQDIFGVDFIVSSKEMEKGIDREDESIGLLNRVRGLSLKKNTERRTNDWLTGECDLYDERRLRGHDIKTSWSLKTFPISEIDCVDKLYEHQMGGYMSLWDAEEWEVNYCMVDTPEGLIRFEPLSLHMVSHIPEEMRVTTWQLKRDRSQEENMFNKICAARQYYAEVIANFDRTHKSHNPAPAPIGPLPWEEEFVPLPSKSKALRSSLASLLLA